LLQLSKSGYPEGKGILYREEGVVRFEPPFPVVNLLRLLTGPSQEEALGGVNEATRKSIIMLQDKVMPVPKVV